MRNVLKRSLSILLAITIIFSSAYVGLGEIDFSELFAVSAKAADESVLTFTLSSDGTYYSVTDCDTSAEGELIIPDTYESLPVTSVGASAFSACKSLTSVTIGNGVTSIGSSAFYNCTSLTSVYITDIAAWCNINFSDYFSTPLYYAKNLYLNSELVTDISIPESVTNIGDYAFYGCTGLNSIKIPDSVSSIGDSAFSNCKNLTVINADENNECFSSVDGVLFNKDKTTLIKYPEGKTDTEFTIPDCVTHIGDRAFSNCDNLTEVTIGNGVTRIGDSGFSDCDSLISITIPDSVTNVGEWAFNSCDSLTSVVIGDNVTSIGQYAFSYCDYLKSAILGDSLTNISYRLFAGCDRLNSIIIPDNVTSIGFGAFTCCYFLESVTIPVSVGSIERYAFESCNSLSNVYYRGLLSDWDNISISSNNTSLTDATISHLCTPDDWVVNAEPTCVKEGLRSANCLVCGGTVTEVMEVIDHSYSTDWTVDIEPSCTEEGSKSHHCTVCDDKTDITPVDANGHSYSEEWTIDVEPSCTEEGSKSHHCTVCDDKTDITSVDANGHSYSEEWTIDVEPSCTEEGSKSHHCTICDDKTDITSVDANGHNYSEDWTIDIEPTCTEEGSKYNTCSVCGDIATETIDANGHSYSDEWTIDVEPTCTEEGSKSHHCTVCDDKIDITTLEAKGHSYGDWVITKEPTCTESGSAERVCNECGYKQDSSQNTEEILLDSNLYPESKHNYANSISETYKFSYEEARSLILTFSSSTLTESNYDYIYIYDATGELYGKYTGSTLAGKEITLNGDSFTIKLTSDSSNTKYGFSFDTIVAAVDALDIIKPHGHSYGEDWIINVEPTCTEEGSKYNTCSVCGYITTEVIDANGHSYSDEWTIDVEPTCTEAGSKSHHCTVCDNKTDITEILATGIHIFDDWVIDYEPSCFNYGLKHRDCKTCDLVEEECIDIISHSDDYEVVIADDSLYTGEEVEPFVGVSYKGEILEYGTDYELFFENNIACGNSAKVTITGLGDYADLNVTKTFSIYKRDISEAEVYVEDCVYDRFQQKPGVTVTVDGIELTADEDYILDYINNSSLGTATVKVIGINNFYGFVEENFEITYDNRTITLEGGVMGVNPTPSYNSIVMGPGKLKCTVPCNTKFLFSYKIKDGETGEVIDSYDSGRNFVYSSSCYIYYDFSTLASSTELKDYLIQFSWTDYNANSYGGFLSVFINPSSPNEAKDFSLSVLESSSLKNDYVLINTEYESYDIKTPVWTSSDNSIATVENGTVAWLAPGTVTITAITCGISRSVELTKERCDLAAYGEIVTAEYFYGEPAIGVTYNGELLEESVDYSLTVTDYGEYSIAEVTGKNLFKGSIFKKIYNDCGSPYICEHTFSDWAKTLDGGCTKTTVNTRFCTECGYVEREVIAPVGHISTDYVIVKNENCTEDGLKEKYCSVCNETLDSVVIPAIGHNYSNWVVIANEDCVTDGLREKTCSNCGDKVEETILATGHSSTDWIIDSVRSCTTDGVKHKDCTVCGEELDKIIQPATGHDLGDWEEKEYATCTTDGLKVRTCNNCGEDVEKVVIPAFGHDEIDNWEVRYEPDCDDDGLKIKYCETCGKTTDEKVIKKLGHTYTSWTIQKSTSVYSSGIKYRLCENCSHYEKKEIPQLKCSKPTLKTISNTSSGVKITWGKVKGADKYYVYRKVKGGSYSRIGSTTNSYYTDKTAKSGKKYYYIVKAINEAGASSSSSALSKLYLADPTLKTPKSTKKGVKLEWSKVKGADGYVIYYKTGSGSYKKLTTVKGSSKVTYTHTKAKKGKTYTYKVKAYKSKTYSAYSNTKKIKDKY